MIREENANQSFPRLSERAIQYGLSSNLNGILTRPPSKTETNQPCLVVLNAGILHKAGPNRLHVRLARAAAQCGFPTFRFDFAGVGDSPPRGDGRPLAEGVLVDIAETLDLLEARLGASRFILAGLCSGADNSLRAARTDSRVVGAALLDPTVHRTPRWYLNHYLPRLRNRERINQFFSLENANLKTISANLQQKFRPGSENERPELFRTGLSDKQDIAQHIEDALRRDCHLFYGFTGGWKDYYNYPGQLMDLYPNLSRPDLIHVRHYPETSHTFKTDEDRNRLIRDLTDWMKLVPTTRKVNAS